MAYYHAALTALATRVVAEQCDKYRQPNIYELLIHHHWDWLFAMKLPICNISFFARLRLPLRVYVSVCVCVWAWAWCWLLACGKQQPFATLRLSHATSPPGVPLPQLERAPLLLWYDRTQTFTDTNTHTNKHSHKLTYLFSTFCFTIPFAFAFFLYAKSQLK